MKKTLRTLAVILVLALFALMALGSGSGSTAAGGQTAQSGSVSGTTATNGPAPMLEETVLLDAAGVKITVKSLEMNSLFGASVKLLIENNTDKNLTVGAQNVSVNGYMVESLLYADVAAGKKANDELSLLGSDLEAAGITTIADLEFSFHIVDSDTWAAYLDTDPICLQTSAAEGFVYEYDDSGFLAYSGDGVEIVVKGISDDSIFGPSIVVYISNTSGRNICVQARDVSINGFMVQQIFSVDVAAGKHAIDRITFFDSDLEENEITVIQQAELSFHIFDSDSWRSVTDTAPITLSFEG